MTRTLLFLAVATSTLALGCRSKDAEAPASAPARDVATPESPPADGPSEEPPAELPPTDERSTDEPPSEDRGDDTEGNIVVGDADCASDADCVPAQCCHATECTSKDQAPDCAGMMCTQECQSGTIDCGGGCLCRDGKCAARLMESFE